MPNRLKELRNEKGLTTRELAEIYGVSHASISRAETGDRNLNEDDIAFFTKFFISSACSHPISKAIINWSFRFFLAVFNISS